MSISLVTQEAYDAGTGAVPRHPRYVEVPLYRCEIVGRDERKEQRIECPAHTCQQLHHAPLSHEALAQWEDRPIMARARSNCDCIKSPTVWWRSLKTSFVSLGRQVTVHIECYELQQYYLTVMCLKATRVNNIFTRYNLERCNLFTVFST
jgi:hypothetical protein